MKKQNAKWTAEAENEGCEWWITNQAFEAARIAKAKEAEKEELAKKFLAELIAVEAELSVLEGAMNVAKTKKVLVKVVQTPAGPATVAPVVKAKPVSHVVTDTERRSYENRTVAYQNAKLAVLNGSERASVIDADGVVVGAYVKTEKGAKWAYAAKEGAIA